MAGRDPCPTAGVRARQRRPALLLACGLLGGTVAAWLCALMMFHAHPALLGTAVLAYGLGLRHAVDADHIAAIDNVTRKLCQDGQRPATVGLFFSLGHSSVVVLATFGIIGMATAFSAEFAQLRAVGGPVATAVSAGFLFALAAINAIILRGTWRVLARVRANENVLAEDLQRLLQADGPLARLLRPCFRLIRRSWHMYPLGFLFGIGFDTASELALLGLSAAEAAKGLPLGAVMVLPALFTAGMTLVDTADGLLMMNAYEWAFVRPLRKLYYNLAITFVSVLVATGIGAVELLNMIGTRLGLPGPFWAAVDAIGARFNLLGYAIIAVFAALWLGSVVLTRISTLRTSARV